MLSDLRFALRQLAKSPGFTAIVVVTLALGIGACTVVFTVVKSTLLDIVKGADFDRIVFVHETQLPQRPQLQLSPPTFLDLEREAKSFEFLSAWTGGTLNLTGDDEPQRLSVASVTAHTFAAWSMRPALGRTFLPDEFTAGKEKVVVLSFGLWQRSFGGARDVIDRKILFDGEPYMVVGVLGEQFQQFGSNLDAFVPLVFTDRQRLQQRGSHYLQVTGRLKPDVTVEQAQAELNLFAARLAAQYPDTNKGGGLLVRNFGPYLNRTLAPMLHILLGVVGCVLLVACANVANLLLARATTRQKEIAVRAALGASRAQIVRQLLIESVVLALAGGAAGVLLAQWGLQFVRTFAPSAGTDFARLAFVELDGRMLGFALLFSAATGIAFGLAPAWLTSRVDLNDALKQGTRGSTEGGARGRLRNGLAALEIALALVLLTGAGLLIRSFVQLAHVDPGFTVERVATANIFFRTDKYRTPEQRIAYADALLERFHRLPGAEAAAFTSTLPFASPAGFSFAVADRPFDSAANLPSAVPYLVTPEYFRTMGIRLLRGRTVGDQDRPSAPFVVVVNETLARQFFPNEEALGRQLRFPTNLPNVSPEIVGVVSDTMQGNPGTPTPPQIYFAWRQFSTAALTAVVRTSGDPGPALAALKSQVHEVDPTQPVFGVRTLEKAFGDTLARQRLMLRLLVAFAGVALVIAAVGLYGVMAYSVGQRTTEFGIRMALGAGSRDILGHVMRTGMKIAAVGVSLGLVAAFALGRLIEALLYQTNPRDPLTLGLIASVLAAVAFLACLIPARRATKVDPLVALRAE
jgi:putative ABC transport system permease protein